MGHTTDTERLNQAIAADGHAPYPAGSLLKGAERRWPGDVMAPPGAPERLAEALRWMTDSTRDRGSGGTLGSLIQRSTAAWLDRNGLSSMTLTAFVRAAVAQVLHTAPGVLDLPAGQPVEAAQEALAASLARKAKSWQERRSKPPQHGAPDWPRLLQPDTVAGDALCATARQMNEPLQKADLLARYALKLLGSGLALDMDDLVSLRVPVLRAWERHALNPDPALAAKAAWLGRPVARLLNASATERDLLKKRAARQLAVFNPWVITDSAELDAVEAHWQALHAGNPFSPDLPLTPTEVWGIAHAVLRDLTDPALVARGLWTPGQLERLAELTEYDRGRRQGRALLRPLRKLVHDHATWVTHVLKAPQK